MLKFVTLSKILMCVVSNSLTVRLNKLEFYNDIVVTDFIEYILVHINYRVATL